MRTAPLPGRAGARAGLGVLLAAGLALSGCRQESPYPDHPIMLVCPWAVGGGTDAASRQLAVFLEAELGVPVNVVNATGGAGVTGHSRGARARPDGYTLTMMTVEINMLRWRKLTSISWEDFTPLILLNREAAALFVRRDAPWRSLGELAQAIRKEPGALRASGTSIGGIWHLALAGWLTAAGLEPDHVRWIPMNGAGPSLQDLAGGGLHMVCCSLPEGRSLVEAGEVRPLGVMADQRLGDYPEVPTFKEQGFDWSMGGWRGVGAPRGLPEKIRDILLGALERIVRGETRVSTVQSGQRVERTFPAVMQAMGANVSCELPAEFRRTLERLDAELGRLLGSDAFSAVTRGPIGPLFFPRLLLALGALVLLLLALAHWLDRSPRRAPPPSGGPGGWIHVLEVTGSVVLYIFLAERLGFVLTAGGLLFLLLLRLGNRLRVSVLVPAVLVPAVYHLFANGLDVPLPRVFLEW